MSTYSNVTWLATPRQVSRSGRPGLMQMLRAIGTRRMLAEMDDRMLADIGVSRADAQMEASRAPWDLSKVR